MKIVKHIPNTITSMNLLCGTIGVICALDGRLGIAFLFMLGAALCDFCDGLCARMLNAYSDVGKELDSLADLVSFGVLPAMMFRETVLLAGVTGIISYVPLLLVVFSALRLAKFNIDETQAENFRGLATPASAMLTGSFSYYVFCSPDSMMTGWPGSPAFSNKIHPYHGTYIRVRIDMPVIFISQADALCNLFLIKVIHHRCIRLAAFHGENACFRSPGMLCRRGRNPYTSATPYGRESKPDAKRVRIRAIWI